MLAIHGATDHNASVAQGQVLLAAAFAGDASSASFLCQLYANSTSSDASDATAIDPDLRGAAYHAAVAHLGDCLSESGEATASFAPAAFCRSCIEPRTRQQHTLIMVWSRLMRESNCQHARSCNAQTRLYFQHSGHLVAYSPLFIQSCLFFL